MARAHMSRASAAASHLKPLPLLVMLLLLCQGEGAGFAPGATSMILPGLGVPDGHVRIWLNWRRGLCGPGCTGLQVQQASQRGFGVRRPAALKTGHWGWPRAPAELGGQTAPLLSSSSGQGVNGQGLEGAGGPIAFPKLANFNTVTKLLDAVEPFLAEGSEGEVRLSGRNAAHVMNKLKSLFKSRSFGNEAATERKRADAARKRLVHVTAGKIDELGLKHLALALNAVKGSRGRPEAELAKVACDRAVALLREEVQHAERGIPPSVPAQTVAMLVNALAMGAGGLLAAKPPADASQASSRAEIQDVQDAGAVELVFEISTRVLLAMSQDAFDAQSISTTMNAYASAGLWNLALFRQLGSMTIALPPQEMTLQSVAMVVNAYSRLMEQERILTAWDVEEADAQLFRGMSVRASVLAEGLATPPPSTAHSVALIVNALAKVGVTDKKVFVALSGLLLRAPAGKVDGSLRYDAQAVSNIVNAFAKANVRDERLFRRLADVAMHLPMSSFAGQHVATILNAYTRLDIENPKLFEHMSSLLRYWDRFGQLTPNRLGPQAVALILNAFARAKIEDRDLFERMARLVQLHLHSPADGPLTLVPHSSPGVAVSQPVPQASDPRHTGHMSPQAVSNIVNACANGDFRAPELLVTLERTIMAFNGTDMSLQHVSCIANGMVRLGHGPAPLLRHLTNLARNVASPSPSDPSGPLSLSLLANALCKGETSDERAFHWIAAEARRYPASAYSAQSVAMLANAFARAGCRDHALFRQLCDVCMSLAPEAYDEQSIANIANAFARNSQAWTKHADAAPGSYNRLILLFQRLAKIAIRPDMWAFSSQSVALIVNAYAKLGIKDARLFRHLSKVAQQMGSRNFELPCKPLHVAQVCNAFAKANVHDEKLFRRMSELVKEQSASDFDSRIIGTILNAYAHHRIRDLELVAVLSSVARAMPAASFDAQAIGNIFHALAALNIRDDALIDHMASTILRSRQTIMQTEDYNGQALANIAWSMAVLQQSDLTLNRWICNMCAQRIKSMDRYALRQLHQFILAHEVEGLVKRERLPELDALLKHRSRIEKAWDQHQRSIFSARQYSAAAATSSMLQVTQVGSDVSSQGVLDLADVDVVGAQDSLKDLAEDVDQDVWMVMDEDHASTILASTQDGSLALGRPYDNRQYGAQDLGKEQGRQDNLEDSSISDPALRVATGNALAQSKDSNAAQVQNVSNLQMDVAATLRSLFEPRTPRAHSEADDPLGASLPDSIAGSAGMLQLVDANATQLLQIEVLEEVTENITGYSLDMLVQGTSLLIEVDGPSHYARGTRIPLGATVMKRRQLTAVGYQLCSIPFWQWPTGMPSTQKKHFLASALALHLQVPPQEADPPAGSSATRQEQYTVEASGVPLVTPPTTSTKTLSTKLQNRKAAQGRSSSSVAGPEDVAASVDEGGTLLPKPFRVGSSRPSSG